MNAPETVFPIDPAEAGEGGEGGVFQITNAEFVATVFPQLPDVTFAAVSSNPVALSLGGRLRGAKI